MRLHRRHLLALTAASAASAALVTTRPAAAQAAWPSLMIVLTACGPIILLSRQIMRSRPGDQSL
jgi:hypothetical protein